MNIKRKYYIFDKFLVIIAIFSPIIGATVARAINYFPEPTSFWQGLIVQIFLSLALIEFLFSKTKLSSLGISFKNSKLSLLLFLLYSILYVSVLFIASNFGIKVSHFDEARKILGNLIVIALYIPFWGLLEGFWIVYFMSKVNMAIKSENFTWIGLLVSSLIFGIFHFLVMFILGLSLIEAIQYIAVAFTLLIAGSIAVISKNSLGTLLFWVIFNF